MYPVVSYRLEPASRRQTGPARKPPQPAHQYQPASQGKTARGSGRIQLLLSYCSCRSVHSEMDTRGHTRKLQVICQLLYEPATRANGHVAWFALLVNVVLARSESRAFPSSSGHGGTSASFELDASKVSSIFFSWPWTCTTKLLAEEEEELSLKT